jgi:DNA-binding CsgD family transcriptional regulator
VAGQARRQPSEQGIATALTTAVGSADIALGLVDLSDCTIASMSQPWLSHLGLPAEAVIGRPAIDLIRFDKEAALQVLTSMRDGAISAYVARREFNAPPGVEPMATVWVRSFHVGARHFAFVQVAPASDDAVSPLTKHLGREPAAMVIGTIDPSFTITAMSRDITDLLGVRPEAIVGQVLLTVVARRDVTALLAASDDVPQRAVALRIHLRHQDGRWVELCCVMTSLAGNPDRCFILVPEPEQDETGSRVAELEHHLWNIAAIVEATGVLQRVGPMRDMTALPQANSLTTRQWEILARIVRGERAPAIAADLHVSQSTVRNHLSAIFKRFGVRSQPELLAVINAAPNPAAG